MSLGFLTFTNQPLGNMTLNRPSLWPIAMGTCTDNPVSQSQLEANACNRLEARENLRVRVTIGSAKEANANPKQRRITFDTRVNIKETLILVYFYYKLHEII